MLLIALSWLWNPHSGFVGIGHLLSRYLMSLGLPFEVWVQKLAEVAEQEAAERRTQAAAVARALRRP